MKNTMNASSIPLETRRERSMRRIALTVRVIWTLARLPVLAVLIALEPVASLVLSTVAVLGITAALFLRQSGVLPQFPFWSMLGMSVATLLLLTAYRALIRLLAL